METLRRRTPVERAIWELGGKGYLSRQFGIHTNTIRAWEKNNRIPAKWQPRLMELAQANGIELKAEDLIG